MFIVGREMKRTGLEVCSRKRQLRGRIKMKKKKNNKVNWWNNNKAKMVTLIRKIKLKIIKIEIL